MLSIGTIPWGKFDSRWKQLDAKQASAMTVIPSVQTIGAVVRKAPILGENVNRKLVCGYCEEVRTRTRP